MKKFGFIVLISAVAIALVGCGKKQQTLEEMQQPMSMETLSTMSTTAPAGPETKAPETKVEATPAVSKAVNLEPLPPSGPYKPAATEIQTALKNANYYTGAIDGKLGPKTKKAIMEFQTANGLTADGKVGPKTWAALSVYLTQTNPSAASGVR